MPRHPFDDLRHVSCSNNVAWCPVEVPKPEFPSPIEAAASPLVVWPHRHEHDKGPDLLLDLARSHRGNSIRWALLGERFDQVPEGIKRFREEFAHSIVFDGCPSRNIYESILGSADWVCSTARHEFFGLAVVESMFAGCMPWVPSGLSYRELLPAAARGLSPATPPDDRPWSLNKYAGTLVPPTPNATRRIDSRGAFFKAASPAQPHNACYVEFILRGFEVVLHVLCCSLPGQTKADLQSICGKSPVHPI